jgi:hypothetical protein
VTKVKNEHPISAEVVGYFKDLSIKFMGSSDILVECTYCHESLQAWEALCVAHLFTGGVPAHLNCPKEAFLNSVHDMGIEQGFDFTDFSIKIGLEMDNNIYPDGTTVSGILDLVEI